MPKGDKRAIKISLTFKKKGLHNFSNWQTKQKQDGLLPAGYLQLEKNGDLAELIGVILGDGHIEQYPRTERLLIFSNGNNAGFISRYISLLGKVFGKKPTHRKMKSANCVRMGFYQKNISNRLKIPCGARAKFKFKIPEWIWTNQGNLIRFLRGLYEAEGSFCVHKPTSTYKLLFSNRNPFLLKAVYDGIQKLGFHPHCSRYQVQLSRKEEVYRCKELLQFRKY